MDDPFLRFMVGALSDMAKLLCILSMVPIGLWIAASLHGFGW